MTLTSQLTELTDLVPAKADAGRCWPQCCPADWRDMKPVNKTIRTICGKCGTLIGYRPVERKQPASET